MGHPSTNGSVAGSVADEALSTLRTKVAAADSHRPSYLQSRGGSVGKSYQNAHDVSGWDRKARYQRAFNTARTKMGMTGMDDSVDAWGPAAKDLEAAASSPDRRSVLHRRNSMSHGGGGGGGGGAVALSPGAGGAYPIAELRTPVALKEHLRRGKGTRDTGIQLTALDSSWEGQVAEEDAAAIVAQFEARRQMLGGPPLSPAGGPRVTLTPTDRALRAWTNNNNGLGYGSGGSGDNSPALGASAANSAAAAPAALPPRRFSENGTYGGVTAAAAYGSGGGSIVQTVRRSGVYDSIIARRQPQLVHSSPLRRPSDDGEGVHAATDPAAGAAAAAAHTEGAVTGAESPAGSGAPPSPSASPSLTPQVNDDPAGTEGSSAGGGGGGSAGSGTARDVQRAGSFGRRLQAPPPLRLGGEMSSGGASLPSPSLPALPSPLTDRSSLVCLPPPRPPVATMTATSATEGESRPRLHSPTRNSQSPSTPLPLPIPVLPNPCPPATPQQDPALAATGVGVAGITPRRPHPRISAPGDVSLSAIASGGGGGISGGGGVPSGVVQLQPLAFMHSASLPPLGPEASEVGATCELSETGLTLTPLPTPVAAAAMSAPGAAAAALGLPSPTLPSGESSPSHSTRLTPISPHPTAIHVACSLSTSTPLPKALPSPSGLPHRDHQPSAPLPVPPSPPPQRPAPPSQPASPASAPAVSPLHYRRTSTPGNPGSLGLSPGSGGAPPRTLGPRACTPTSAPVHQHPHPHPHALTPHSPIISSPAAAVPGGGAAGGVGAAAGLRHLTARLSHPGSAASGCSTPDEGAGVAGGSPGAAGAAAAAASRLLGGGAAAATTAAAAAAPAAATPVTDNVLAGLRKVAAEAQQELEREAESNRAVAAIRSRMRAEQVAAGAKPRNFSLPGDPWKKF